MDASPFAEDHRQRGWLESAGYTCRRRWLHMSRPVDPTELMPPLREGVTVRRVARHENGVPLASDLQIVHLMLEESFQDHFNSYRESFPEFVQRLREDPGHRWDHWWLAWVSTPLDQRQTSRSRLRSTSEETSRSRLRSTDGMSRRGRSSARCYRPTAAAPRAPTSTTSASTARPAAAGWPRVCCTRCSPTRPRAAATGSSLEVDADSPTKADGLYVSMGWSTDYVTESWFRDVEADGRLGAMSESTEYDVIVVGLGPGGEHVAIKLGEAGLRVLGIEERLVGGECPYYGCVPSKMMIAAAHTLREAHRVNTMAGSATVTPDWTPVANRIRDEATDDWDDAVAVKRLEDSGATFVRGRGVLAGDGRVEVGGTTYTATKGVVINTGTAPAAPPIDGLADTPYWTNRDAVQLRELPSSLIVIGGGAIGCELAQVMALFGVRVTVVEMADRLVAPEEPEASEALEKAFAEHRHPGADRRDDRLGCLRRRSVQPSTSVTSS